MFVEIIQIIIVALSIYGAVTLKGKARAFLVAGTILCIGLYIYFFAVSGFAGFTWHGNLNWFIGTGEGFSVEFRYEGLAWLILSVIFWWRLLRAGRGEGREGEGREG